MNLFEKPVMEVVVFAAEDVIATSNVENGEDF